MLFGQETPRARDCSSYVPKAGSVLHGTNRAGDLGRLRVSSGGLPLPSSDSTQRQGVAIRLPWRWSFGFKPKTNAESLRIVNTFPHQHRPDKHHSAAPAPGQRPAATVPRPRCRGCGRRYLVYSRSPLTNHTVLRYQDMVAVLLSPPPRCRPRLCPYIKAPRAAQPARPPWGDGPPGPAAITGRVVRGKGEPPQRSGASYFSSFRVLFPFLIRQKAKGSAVSLWHVVREAATEMRPHLAAAV